MDAENELGEALVRLVAESVVDDAAVSPSKDGGVAHWRDEDRYDDDEECFQCGGEGYVFDCIDGLCLEAEIGCDDCTRPCDVCSPSAERTTAHQESTEGAAHSPSQDATRHEARPKGPSQSPQENT